MRPLVKKNLMIASAVLISVAVVGWAYHSFQPSLNKKEEKKEGPKEAKEKSKDE